MFYKGKTALLTLCAGIETLAHLPKVLTAPHIFYINKKLNFAAQTS